MLRKIFFSMPTALLLLFGLVVSIVCATLLERTYGASSAKVLIYNAHWFEFLWIWFSIALVVNMIRFRLWQKRKRTVFLFHFSFLLILLGAILTRYFKVEGLLHLREGESSNQFFSSTLHLFVQSDQGIREYPLAFSPIGKQWKRKMKWNGDVLTLRLQQYIPNAEKRLIEAPDGDPVVHIAVFTQHFSNSLFLEKGGIDSSFGIYFGLDNGPVPHEGPFVQFKSQGKEVWVWSNRPIVQKNKLLKKPVLGNPGTFIRCNAFSIYTVDSVSFVLIQYDQKGRIQAVPSENLQFSREEEKNEAVELALEMGAHRKTVSLFYEKGKNDKKRIFLNGKAIMLQLGPKGFELPFSLSLQDFRIERYPNSQRPSQFFSNVVIEDAGKHLKKPYAIYMNHILKHRGYRIYQHDFDKDEKGSIFLITRDPGTPVTYLGYLFLILSLVFAFVSPRSRIRELGKRIRESRGVRWVWGVFFLLLFLNASSIFSQPRFSSEKVLNSSEISFEKSLSSFRTCMEKIYFHGQILERLGRWLIGIGCGFLWIGLMRFGFKTRFKKLFPKLALLFHIAIWLGFLALTSGLGIRWYLSGHPPLANKYESMLFFAWASLLAGIVLSRHSSLPMICGSLFSGLVLLLAHGPSVDASLSPLAPVLKSKWLLFHVSTALASYGFFAIGTLLAFFNILVLALPVSKKENRFLPGVSLWASIVEQALWLGLFFIILGTVLGAIWANETWGRYWGWDPKEAWTLIVLLTYAILLHLRYVVQNWPYWLNVLAFPSFGTVLMTYWGVNVFFSGMHAYGREGEASFPWVIVWILGIWGIFSIFAYRNRKCLS